MASLDPMLFFSLLSFFLYFIQLFSIFLQQIFNKFLQLNQKDEFYLAIPIFLKLKVVVFLKTINKFRINPLFYYCQA